MPAIRANPKSLKRISLDNSKRTIPGPAEPVSTLPYRTPANYPKDDALLTEGHPFTTTFAPQLQAQPTVVNDSVEVLSASDFHLIPDAFKGQLQGLPPINVPRTFDPSHHEMHHVLSPMVPLEGKQLEQVRKSWSVMNEKIAQDINKRMREYFKKVKKTLNKKKRVKVKRKNKVHGSIWVENLPVLASADAIPGNETTTWTAVVEGDSIPGLQEAIYSRLVEEGYGWVTTGNCDLYKNGSKEVAVYSRGNEISVTAFTVR